MIRFVKQPRFILGRAYHVYTDEISYDECNDPGAWFDGKIFLPYAGTVVRKDDGWLILGLYDSKNVGPYEQRRIAVHKLIHNHPRVRFRYLVASAKAE